MILDRPWPLRITWLLLPVGFVIALGPALDASPTAAQLLVATLAWAAWTAGLIATLVPRTLGLTVVRILAPTSLGLALWATVASGETIGGAVAAVVAASATVLALAPQTADLFVNGSAYGAERRFALRSPAALLFGPVQIAWALVVAGALVGPLLLAHERWVLGAIATAVGFPVAAVGCRSLHQLARRWLVMVPAGLVIHDPAALTSQLFRRNTIAHLGPAPADTGALDLTAGAPGLALEMQLTQAATLELRQRGQKPTAVHATAVMFTPSRPGAVLRGAAERRIPVA